MRRIHLTCLILLQFISVILFANSDLVPYNESAPLIDHLNSINKEWNQQKDVPTDLLTIPIKFNTDEERIQLHLQLVESILNKRSSDHLTIQQFANRKSNLKSLVEYWNEGQFPINTRHADRQPYFIDDFGTACAVGHLLLTSGSEQLAHHISSVQNYAFIHEMNYPKLNQWASENGFTKDELAWIQPAYSETICYYTDEFASVPQYSDAVQPLSQQEIKTMAEIPGHGILFGGSFLQYDADNDIQTAAIFGYNNNIHVSYSNSIQGTVYDIEYYDGRVYVAGDFVLAGTNFHNIAYWNDTDWVGIQTGDMGGIVKDMVVYDCQLYVGGDFTSVDGNSIANLVTWNGTTWSTTPQDCIGQNAAQVLQVNGAVNTFEVYHDQLAIGGDFTQVVGSPNTVEGLIFWDELVVEFLPPHGSISSVNQLESYETVLLIGEDSLCAYRDGQWYYPGDIVQQDEFNFGHPLLYEINEWEIPRIVGIHDILYDPATASSDVELFEFNNLIISAENRVHAINSKQFNITDTYVTATNYTLITDGVVSAMGVFDTFAGPVLVGNFSNIDITEASIPLHRCGEVSYEADKIFTLNRFILLPIELAEFTVKSTDNKTAQLAWTTLTENNSDYYEIERRTDNEDFMRVGTVAAAGESLEEINYIYEDDISKTSGDYAYYRLKMVDKDGSYEYSDIRSLRLETRDSGISIAPNPTSNYVELSLQMAVGGDVNVRIYDMQGRQLSEYQWTHESNSIARERIEVSHLQAGLYLVEVVSPDERKTLKLDVLK